MRSRTLFVALLLGLTAVAPASAQDATYDPAGRRDPFVSATTLLADQRASCPGNGLAGRLVQEVSLTGIVKSASGRQALLATSDRQTHFASEGSRLCDGRVLRIDADAVVFAQRLRDPLAPARDVEVRKQLHPER